MNFDLAAGIDYVGDRWLASGIAKLEGAGVWKREFVRGCFGSPNAELRTLPPSVASVVAQISSRKAAEAQAARQRALADERMRRPSVIPSSSARGAVKPQPAFLSPDEVAATVNKRR